MELQFLDRVLSCTDCRTDFIFTAGEQLFFYEKQFKNDPKRCKNCKARRAGLSAAASGAEPAAAIPVRTETRTSCSECSVETTVPFKPTQGRPVLCRQCYQKKLRTPPSMPTPGIAAAANAEATAGLHEVVPPQNLSLPALLPHLSAQAITTQEAVAALTALPADTYSPQISPEAVLMAGASISSAHLHSSVATLQDLESIAASVRPYDPVAAIPYELLNEVSPEHADLLAAMAETAEA